jgi:hypothetical protein
VILTCDDRDGGGYIFTFTTNPNDPVRFSIASTERADTMSEVLCTLAEYAEAVEDALAANEDPFTEDNARRAAGEFS